MEHLAGFVFGPVIRYWSSPVFTRGRAEALPVPVGDRLTFRLRLARRLGDSFGAVASSGRDWSVPWLERHWKDHRFRGGIAVSAGVWNRPRGEGGSLSGSQGVLGA